MRKIVAGLFVSLDGVVQSPEVWTAPYYCDEVGYAIQALIYGGDTLLLGRATYQTYAKSFSSDTSMDSMASQMNSIAKVVVSTTLATAEWYNSILISDRVAEQIHMLKQQSGGTITVSGSATLVAWLLRQGLVDDLHLLVYPIVVGRGKRLFDGQGDPVALKLIESTALSTGVIHLFYQPAGSL